MSTLRKTIQREVLSILDEGIFTADDFSVVFGDTEDESWLVNITFNHEPSFQFNIGSENSIGNHHVEISPGAIHDTEYHDYSFEDALAEIDDWCYSIREELKATKPVYRELDELRVLIEEQLSTSLSDSEEFSVPEINELREKLSALSSRVEDLEKENIITQKQLDEFKRGMHVIDEGIEIYPKKTWLKTATNKLVMVVASVGKSQEGRKILAEGARKLLGLD